VGGERTGPSSFSGLPNQPVLFLGRIAQQSVDAQTHEARQKKKRVGSVPSTVRPMGQGLRRSGIGSSTPSLSRTTAGGERSGGLAMLVDASSWQTPGGMNAGRAHHEAPRGRITSSQRFVFLQPCLHLPLIGRSNCKLFLNQNYGSTSISITLAVAFFERMKLLVIRTCVVQCKLG
jgi:hypothetical protein